MSTNKDIDERFDMVRIMGWFRWGLGVFAAVLVSLIIISATVIENTRSGCEKEASRANAVASNWQFAAAARRGDGDFKTARAYMKNVLEIRKTISMPDGWAGRLVDRGKSSVDRHDGCVDAYPRLIPFVN